LQPIPQHSPEASVQLPKVEEVLTQKTAQQVLQNWLSTKAAAFGPDHPVDALKQVLVGPALSQWQRLVQRDAASNRYRQYNHSLKVNSVRTSPATPDQAQVETTVDEVAQIYENGKLNQNSSYHDKNLHVQYDLIREDTHWRIRNMRVIR
jgi:crotonobetainyl-CoA:carnitine CoA-transferase CaiB-like acyl-CoA transferase